jgi:hypothetical protein
MTNRMWLLLIIFLPLQVFSQTPKEIVAQCIKSMGGQKMSKFADYKASGDISYFMRGSEISGTINVIVKPQKYWRQIELDFGSRPYNMKNVYDGQIAFSERNGRISDQPSLNSETDLDHSILLLLDNKNKFMMDNETELDGFKVFGILVESNDKLTLFHIDKNEFVVRQISFKDSYFGENNTKELIEKRIRYSDYKTIDGVLFPMEMVFFEKGRKEFIYKFKNVEFSPQAEFNLFSRPDEELDLRYWEETIH